MNVYSTLHERLVLARPYLNRTLALLTDLQLAQLATAIIDDHHTTTVRREQYLSYHRDQRADAAAIHAGGKFDRTTATGKLVVQRVQRRATKRATTQDKLRIGGVELQRAISNLVVE